MEAFQLNQSNRAISKKVFLFTVLFFMWGLLTVLNFELIGHLKVIFRLNYALGTLIQITFFSSYFVISLLAGYLIKKVGYKKAIISGWLLACVGCFVFYFAVYEKNYQYFLGALFILAAGITILQVGANLYLVLLGSPKTGASRLGLAQAFNSLGTFIAPFFAASVLSYHTHIPEEIRRSVDVEDLLQMDAVYVHYPYLYLGILMLLFAVVLFFVNIPNIDTRKVEPLNKISSLRKRHVLHFPQLRLGAFAIFAYVGAEVALANYIDDKGIVVNYLGLQIGLNQFYWGLAMIGRFIGAGLL